MVKVMLGEGKEKIADHERGYGHGEAIEKAENYASYGVGQNVYT